MGTWDTSIEGNDTFQDIYSNFMERYNSGDDPRQIKRDILSDFADYFADTDDHNNALFGLSKGLWETKSLDKETLDKVSQIITTENDLKLWRDLGATDDIIKKRKDRLDKFLKTISTEKEKPKRRINKKFEFEKRTLVKLTSPDGKKTLDSQPNQDISAKWINNGTLEITHDKSIVFSKKDEKAYFMGDEVKIKYTEK